MRQSTAQLPEEFLTRFRRIFPPDVARTVERTFVSRPTSFRCNTLKISVDSVLEKLKREGFTVKRLGWYRDGFLLTNRSKRELSKLDLFMNGEIYLQSLASMVPVVVLAPKPGERVLDMTAAPGSKTSQIAAHMRREGELFAAEINGIRFQRLEHNMKLLGVLEDDGTFFKLFRGDATKIFSNDTYAGSFDKILLDAPCSGEARFDVGDRNSFNYWNEAAVRTCVSEQRALLQAAWKLLKPGGELVYSTCTFAPEENEQQVSNFLTANSDARLEDIAPFSTVVFRPGIPSWNGRATATSIAKTKRIVPNAEIEGFYIARIKKYSAKA